MSARRTAIVCFAVVALAIFGERAAYVTRTVDAVDGVTCSVYRVGGTEFDVCKDGGK